MAESTFVGIFTVGDNGAIELDLGSSFAETTGTEADAERHATMLGQAMGFPESLTTAERLRQLADVMDAHATPPNRDGAASGA